MMDLSVIAGYGVTGVVVAGVLGIARVIAGILRDRQVTSSRRDEALLPGVLDRHEREREALMARIDATHDLARRAHDEERECVRRCEALAARVRALEESRCRECPERG
jgi:hypothetical protein